MSYNKGFIGPTFRQRLLGYASSATVITVIVDGRSFAGRVLAVDIDNFEMVLTRGTNGLAVGSIVNFSFAELDAIGVDAC
jgi:hypothetical protein